MTDSEPSSLYEFLEQNKCKANKVSTHTRIPDKTLGIYAGSYSISEFDQHLFKKLYCEKVFSQKQQEFLTEAQLPTTGPILIDLDFRYGIDIEDRQHNEDHIIDIVEIYMKNIVKIVDIEPRQSFPVFVLHKEDVNTLEDVTKDGIHLVIGLSVHHEAQMALREEVLEEIGNVLEDLPLKNDYESVIDKGIVTGKTNWQLYGSRKPGNQAYKITHYWSLEWQDDTNEFEYTDMMTDSLDHEEIFEIISARNKKNLKLKLKDAIMERCKKADTGKTRARKRIKIRNIKRSRVSGSTNIQQDLPTNMDELQKSVSDNLQIAACNDDLYEIKEVHQFTMALANFRANDYNEWFKIGLALHSCDSQLLFHTWLLFSTKSEKFNFDDIPHYWNQWNNEFNIKKAELTRGSIMWWCKQDNPDEYSKIKEGTVDYFINKTIENDKPPDYDIAGILHRMYGDQYKCVSIKNNKWYEMVNGRWSEIDSGTTLRKKLSSQLSYKYTMKQKEILNKLYDEDTITTESESKEEEGKMEQMRKKEREKARRVADISLDLRRTTHKNNIMKEAKEHFFDKHFILKLDNNPMLLCFKNGVIDFEKKIFRMTKPDDYVSLCTNIDYQKIDETNEEHMIIKAEITDFMNKLFPEPDINKYMWQHLASSLKGTNENQTFNIYTGTGRNGKSKLVDLLSMCLGDYKGTVPITLITQKRQTIGGASPEIAQLKGKRYACMQEPSENLTINEGIMKELTGGDPLSGRALYCDTITFKPQFKLVVCTNHLFDIKSTDDGTWRRIRVCDFKSKFIPKPYENEKQFPKDKFPYQYKVDKALDQRFERWAPIFISMLIDIVFDTDGVVEDCKSVMASSEKYKLQQDYFAQFFEERIVKEEGAKIKRKDMYNEFTEWYSELYGGKIPKGKDLYDFMEMKIGKPTRGRFIGFKLIHSFEEDLDIKPNYI